jgi:hypothetical protein
MQLAFYRVWVTPIPCNYVMLDMTRNTILVWLMIREFIVRLHSMDKLLSIYTRHMTSCISLVTCLYVHSARTVIFGQTSIKIFCYLRSRLISTSKDQPNNSGRNTICFLTRSYPACVTDLDV